MRVYHGSYIVEIKLYEKDWAEIYKLLLTEIQNDNKTHIHI